MALWRWKYFIFAFNKLIFKRCSENPVFWYTTHHLIIASFFTVLDDIIFTFISTFFFLSSSFLLKWLPTFYNLFIFCLFFSFLSFFFRCPLGQIRASPERAECVFDSDCFGVNQCLNGGTCISESDFRFATSGSGRSISGGRSLTSGTFHGSRSRSRTFCRCPASFEGQRCETVKGPITLNANRDFVIIIIFAIATLLSKFYF